MCNTIVSHETQEQLHTAVKGREGLGPALHVRLSHHIALLLPRVVGGQVKCTGTPWDGDAVSNAGQKVVLSHQLVDFGAQVVQIVKTSLNSGEHVHQHILVDTRVVFVTRELDLVFVQVFEHVCFEICSSPDFDDFKEGGEAKVVVNGELSLNEEIKAAKEVLKPQIGADSLVKGMFKKDHKLRLIGMTK